MASLFSWLKWIVRTTPHPPVQPAVPPSYYMIPEMLDGTLLDQPTVLPAA